MHELLVAGFGGQGVLVLGQLLATAGMLEGKDVTWFPSYGPEQRGGTCNCAVVVSEEDIGSPMVNQSDTAIVMNLPSLERFEDTVRPGGLLIYNSSLIDQAPTRSDVKVIAVPATDVAEELGNSRIANLVALGCFIEATKLVSLQSIEDSLKTVLPARHHRLIPLNMEALSKGRQYQ